MHFCFVCRKRAHWPFQKIKNKTKKKQHFFFREKNEKKRKKLKNPIKRTLWRNQTECGSASEHVCAPARQDVHVHELNIEQCGNAHARSTRTNCSNVWRKKGIAQQHLSHRITSDMNFERWKLHTIPIEPKCSFKYFPHIVFYLWIFCLCLFVPLSHSIIDVVLAFITLLWALFRYLPGGIILSELLTRKSTCSFHGLVTSLVQ